MLLVAHRTPPTRAACERLVAAGAGMFEADVQVDRHARAVVSHYLPFGRYGLVQRDNWRLRWHSAASRDPRLADVDSLVPDGCLVLLDLKEKAADRRARLVAAITEQLPARGRFRVCGGYGPDDLETVRAAGFRTWRTVRDARQLAAVREEGALPDEAITIRHSLLDSDVVASLHEQVPMVVAWTVNGIARAQRLREFGVDGVTTDRIAVLRTLADSS